MKNNNKLSKYADALWLALGEAIVALLVLAGFLIARALGQEVAIYKVITGALLGGAVMVLNFIILSVGVNRAVDKYISERGDAVFTDDEAEKFAEEQGMVARNAMTKSYVLRNLLMIGTLVLAMITGWFSPLATVIPLIAYKPLLYATEFIKIKIKEKRGD